MNFTDNSSTTRGQYHPILFTNSNTWIFYSFISCNAMNIILGLPSNCYIVWLILTGKGTGFVSEFFSLNLAVCEIFYCTGTLIAISVRSFSFYPKLISFMLVMPTTARPLFLCLICVERYVAVVHPVTFLKCKPLRYRLTCSVVVWMIVAGFGVFCMLTLSSNNLYIFICVILPQYLLFFIVKLFCCLAVVRTLKNPEPGERGRQRVEANLMKRRAISVIMILTVAVVVNYTPLLLAGLCYGFLPVNIFMAFWMIGVGITMIVAYVQPFLYLQRFGNLRPVFKMFHNITS